jgi:hypothetical protein
MTSKIEIVFLFKADFKSDLSSTVAVRLNLDLIELTQTTTKLSFVKVWFKKVQFENTRLLLS